MMYGSIDSIYQNIFIGFLALPFHVLIQKLPPHPIVQQSSPAGIQTRFQPPQEVTRV